MSQPPTNPTRARRLPIVVALIVLFAVVQLMTIDADHDWGDFAMYVLHARNLATGVAYADTGYIYNPNAAELGPPAYPPVFPALLAPIYYFFGLSFRLMKAESVVFFAFFLYFVYASFRRDLSMEAVLLLLGAVAVNPFFWRMRNSIASDIPFLALFFGALLVAQRLDGNRSFPVAGGVALGALTYLCYGTRALGAVLLPTVMALDLVRDRRLSRQSIIAGVVFSSGFVAQAVLIPGVGGYVDQLRADPNVVLTNAVVYTRELSYLFLNGISLSVRLILTVVMAALASAGLWLRARQRLTVFEVFPLFYVAIILVWPANQGLRFLMPLVPLLFFYALYALERWRPLQSANARRGALAMLALVLTLSYAGEYRDRSNRPQAQTTGVYEVEAQELFSFVRDNTASDDVVIFRKPRAFTLFTDRPSAVYHEVVADVDLWRYFAEIGASYVVSASWDDPHFAEFLARNRDGFDEVFSNSKYSLLRIRHRPSSSPIRLPLAE